MNCPGFRTFYAVILTLFTWNATAQITDCSGAEVLCSDGVISFNPNGIGTDDFASPGNNSGCLAGGENQTAWYYFEFDAAMPAGSQIEFTIDPNGGAGEDYDFAVFGPDVDCGALGSPIRCSFAASSCGFCPQTGLGNGATDNSEGAGGDGYVAPITVQPGQGFYLLVDNWLGSSNGFDLSWGGSAAPFLNCNADPTCELEANAGPNITICDGDPAPFLQGSALNGMGGVMFNWVELGGNTSFLSNPFVATPTLNVPAGFSGTLTFELTVTEGSCDDTDQVTVTVSPSPTANITGDLDFCTGMTTVLDAGPGHDTYLWSTGSNLQAINVFMGGTYSVTVSNAAGCSDMASVNVIELPNPTPNITGDMAICLGGTGTLDAGPGYSSYLWSDLSLTQIITVMFPGPYSVTVSDANGCIGTADVLVSELPGPEPTITGNLNICAGGSTTLNAGGPYTSYLWSDGTVTQTNTVNSPGNYSVTITDLSGCVGETTVTVNLVAAPEPTITGNLQICPGGSTTLNAGGGYTSYLWSDNSTNQIISPSAPGVYSVTVTSASGCEGVDQVTVSTLNPPSPTISGDLTLCPGASTILTVNGNYSSYLWSDNSSGPSFVANGPGTYGVTVTDANGCQGNTSVTVQANTPPSPSISGNLNICPGGNTILDVGPGYTNYLWFNGSNNQSVQVVGPGDYGVTVTDSEGCQGTATVTVAELIPPTPTISGDNTYCEGGSTQLDAGPGYSGYLWSDGTMTQQLTVNIPGNYQVTVTDANGCTGSTSVSVSELPNPTPDISGELQFCAGNSTTLEGEPGYASYLWSNGALTQQIDVLAPGVYDLEVVDGNGCTGTASVTLNEMPLPTPQIVGDFDFCEGESTSIAVNQTYINYQWTSGGNNQSIDVYAPGNYSVLVTDANGCMGDANVEITQNPIPIPQISGIFEFCEGEQTTLTAEPGFQSYIWSDGSQAEDLIVSEPGIYTLSVVDLNGCEGSQSVEVEENSMPVPVITGALEFCEDGFTVLSLEENYSSYQWSNNSNDQQIVVDNPGIYSVTVSVGTGCEGEAAVEVIQNDLPEVAIQGDPEFCENGNTRLEATAGFETYLWSDNSAGSSLTVSEPGTYTVEVTDGNGCNGTASVEVSTNSLPQPEIAGNLEFCVDGSTIIEVTETYTAYLWSDGTMDNSLEVDTPGDYTVTVTDVNDCQGEITVTLEHFDTFSPEISGAPSICSGEPTTLTAESGYTSYLWSTQEDAAAITVNQAGVYSLTVTDTNGCSGEASIEIMENELPVPDIEGQFYFCTGTETTIQVNENYEAYLWSNNEETQTINVDVAGNYVVTVTDENGCQGTANVMVEENELPEPGISGLLSFCPEGATSLQAIGNFESYLWSTGSDETTIEVNQVGTYSLEVEDEFGCIGTTSAEVVLYEVNIPQIIGALEFCPEGSTTLSVSPDFESYSWSTGSIQPSFEISEPGTVGLTVEDSNGCITSNEVELSLFEVSIPEISGDDAFCTGETVTLSANDGFSSYQWSDQSQSQSISVTEEGEYFVTVTDANDCITVSSFFVEENPLPNLTIGGSTSYCVGGSTTLNAGGVYEIYAWSDGSGESTLEVSSPGLYELTVTDANGCINSAAVTVIEDTELSPVITGALAFCPEESTIIDAGTGFATYQWSNDTNGQTLEVSSPGVYSVTVTDEDGCFGSDEVEIVQLVPPSPTIIGPDAFCEGETISLNTQSGYEDILWSTGSSSVSISLTEGGDYSVTVTDTDGCVGETSHSVELLDVPVISIEGQDFFCEGSSTTLTLASSQVLISYDWSDGSAESSLEVSTPGIYSVEVSNAGGCTATAEMQIEEIALPVADAGADLILNCDITSVILGGNGTSVGSNYNYQWQGPGISESNDEDLFPEVFEPGIYSLIVTDQIHNCISEEAIISIEDQTNDPAVIVQAIDILDCSTTIVIIDGSASESGTNIVYQWYDENGNMIAGANSPMLETSSPELFMLEVMDTTTGCYNTASVQVEADVAYPIADAGLPQLLNCYVTSLNLDGTASTEGEGIAYFWSTSNGQIQSGATSTQPLISAPGTYFITVVDTINACQNQDSVIVSQDITPPVAEAGLNQELDCLTPEVILDGTGSSIGAGYSYDWTSGNSGSVVLATTPQMTATTPDIYTLLVTDLNNGCTSLDVVEVTENGSIPNDLEMHIEDPTCFGDQDGSILIQEVTGGTPPYVYSLNGQEFSSNMLFPNLGSGIFEITVQDAIGCEYTTELFLEEGNDLVLDLGEDIYINLGQSATLQALSNVPYEELGSFSWKTRDTLDCLDCPVHEVRPFETMEYAATIVDENGCVATDQLTVFVNHPDEVFIPNVFSPNNDGINDVFMIFAGEDVKVINSFLVFNRWGETVFDIYNIHANDPAYGWNGQFRGKQYNSGVFVYMAEVEFIDGTVKLFKGDVAIMK